MSAKKKKAIKKTPRKKVAKKATAKKSGAQPGNQNERKGLEARASIKRALARIANERTGSGSGNNSPNDRVRGWRDGLDKVMDQYAKAGAEGAPWAIKDLIDRLDGKAAQAITVGGDEDNPLKIISEFRRTIV